MLARLSHGIEQKFPAIRDGDADHCRLGSTLGRDTRLDRPGLGTHVGQHLGWREGEMMFAHGGHCALWLGRRHLWKTVGR